MTHAASGDGVDGAGAMGSRTEARRPFTFAGSGGEFFRIWVVNVLLSIVTLGIYSAWAKVRAKRYFYGNTRLDGSTFEYLATPAQILKGRIVVVVFLVAWSVVAEFWPAIDPAIGLVFLIALPWLVVRAHRFNARYSAYRNVRFRFDNRYGQAIWAYVALPLLSVLTLGLLLPFAAHQRARFAGNKLGFGQARFAFGASVRRYYAIYLIAFVSLLVILALSGATLAAIAENPGTGSLLGVFVIPMWMAAMIALGAYGETAINNHVWNNLQVDRFRFESTLRMGEMFPLLLTNTLMVVFTLGLLIPVARVRLARYRLSRLTLLGPADLDGFVAGEKEQMSAIGEEMGDLLDIEIGL